MSIPVSAAAGKPAAPLAQDATRVSDDGSTVSAGAKAHAELNVSIVQASLSVSISSGNEPLALLYKSAITNINESLKADFGDNAIENAVGQDNSPAATANRIVTQSTAFYDAYKRQHVGEDEATTRKGFVDTIRGGVEQGFKEARDILGGLKVLNGEVGSNIDKTYALVQQGLDAFLGATAPAAPAAPAAAPAARVGAS